MDSRVPGAGIFNFDYAEYFKQQQALDALVQRREQPAADADVPVAAAAAPAPARRRTSARRPQPKRPEVERSDDALAPLKVKTLPKPYDVDAWAQHGTGAEQRRRAADRIAKAERRGGREIDLAGLGLRGLHPQLLPSTTEHLRLTGNDLAALPSEVTALPVLHTVYADRNVMRSLPDDIGRLSFLRDLNLSGNKLRSLPESFGGLRSLLGLRLDHNKLESVPASFALLDKLQVLSVSNNLLTGANALPPQMGILTELRELDLSNNRIESVPEAWGEMFKTLRRANLSGNHLLGLPESFISPVKSQTLDLSRNPSMATLPRSFGGFSYVYQVKLLGLTGGSDDWIVSPTRLKVNTAETRIRQGLVNEARLEDGRGLRAQRYFNKADQLPPNRIFNNDLDEIYSVHDYIADEGAPGQVIGLDRIPQAAGAPALYMGPPGALGDAMGAARGQRTMDSWLCEQADKYADRLNGTAPAPAAAAHDTPPDTLDALWPDAMRPAEPEPGFGPEAFIPGAGLMPPAVDHLGLDLGARMAAAPAIAAQLQHELQQLPQLLQFMPPELQQRFAPLLMLPPEALLAQLMGAQGQPLLGSLLPGFPALGPPGLPLAGGSYTAGSVGSFGGAPYASPLQPAFQSPAPPAYFEVGGPSGYAGPGAGPADAAPMAASAASAQAGPSGPRSTGMPTDLRASTSVAGGAGRPAATAALELAAAAGAAAAPGWNGVGRLKQAVTQLFARSAEPSAVAQELSRMSVGEGGAPQAPASESDLVSRWPTGLVPPAGRPPAEPEPKGWLSNLMSMIDNG